MRLVDWLRQRRIHSQRQPRQHQQRRRYRRYAPCDAITESLEDRALLATLTVTNTDDSGAGSLRAAIEASNASVAEDDTITFQIPGSGPHVIALQSPLPIVRDTVVIDGASQPGYVDAPKIFVSGTMAGSGDGLSVQASGSVVRGLGITDFAGNGIQVRDANNVRLLGNHIGLDADGVTAAGNAGHGILLESGALQGDNPVLMFLVDTSGSVTAQFSGSPVGDLNNDGLSNTIIDASIAGLTAAVERLIAQGRGSSVAVGIENFDMDLVTPGTQLTTFPSSDTNNNGVSDVIDILRRLNTTVDGIRYDPFHPNLAKAVDFFTTLNVPDGNGNLVVVSDGYISVNRTALADLEAMNVRRRGIAVGTRSNLNTMRIIDPNAVQVTSTDELRDAALSIISGSAGAAALTVGGPAADASNVIAYNAMAGIRIASQDAIGNRISGNAIFSNGGLGIDLGPEGISLNDFDDADSGTNDLTNYPWITSVVELDGRTYVRGILQALPATTYSVELFRSPTADSSGFGEGRQYLTTLTTTTNAGGTGAFAWDFAGLTNSDVISATATDADGNTSEFSRARPVDPSDPFADALISYDPTDSSRVVFFNEQNADVVLGEGMPAEPFRNRTTADSLASIIDAPSARAREDHTPQTNVGVSGRDLSLEFDLRGEFPVTTFHFWNDFDESFDVDSITLQFFDNDRNPVGGAFEFSPRPGGSGGNSIAAEDFDLSLEAPVRYASVLLRGSNGEVNFSNIGFSAAGSSSGLPTHPAFTNPDDALEAPDYPASGAPGLPGSVALGVGGLLNVEFIDNRLLNTGDRQFDLQIYEADPEAEATRVAVRPTAATRPLLTDYPDPDGDGFLDVGTVAGGLSYVDLDAAFPGFAAGALVFDAVQLIDRPDQGSHSGDTAGADIDAVVALAFQSLDGDFEVSQTGINTLVSESGLTDTFSVVLTVQPESAVVLDLSVDLPGEARLDKTTLTFTPADWDIPQIVTVSAIDELRDDGDQVAFVTIAVNSQTTDGRYAARADKSVPVIVTDNDTLGISVSKSQALVSESGTTDVITVVLNSEPAADVVLNIASDDPDEVDVSLTELTFTPQNWLVPQTLEFQGKDDFNTDGDQLVPVTISVNPLASDNQYDDVADLVIDVTNADDDVPGLVVVQSDGTTSSRESGAPDSFLIRLTTQPVANVRIFVSSVDETNATVSTDTVLLTPATWNTGVSVDVVAVDDVFVDGTNTSQIQLSVDDANSDDFYDDVADQFFTVETTDDDEPGFVINNRDVTISEQGSAQVSVILASAPVEDVVISVQTNDAGEATASPSQLIFTPQNWGEPHVVTITGVADLVVDSPQTITISLNIDDDASDPQFAPLASQEVSVTVTNSDVPGFRYSHTGGNTTTSEFGVTDSFTVELTGKPETDVTLGVLATDGTEVAISRRRLTFSPNNWNIPQTVSVTGQNDFFIDGDITSDILLSVEEHLSTPAFAQVPDQTVPVKNIDDDRADLIISQTSVTVDEAGGGETVFVSLTSQPRSNVVLTLSSSDTSEVTVQPAAINFLPGNWNVPRAVSLQPVTDDMNDGNQNATITLSVNPLASDDAFDELGDHFVHVLARDNDLSRVLSPTGIIHTPRPTITMTEFPGAESYEIWLERIGGANNPVANPTITGTSYLLPEDLPGGRYRTWVRTNLPDGSRTSWDQATFVVSLQPQLQPVADSGLRPVLQWDPVPGASSYRVYSSNLTSGQQGTIDEMTTATSFVPDADLGLGHHRFWVQAIGSGFQAWSSFEDYLIGPTPTVPLASTISVRPTLTWQNVPETASVRLYVTGPGGVVLDARGLTGDQYTLPFDLDVGRHRWWLQPTHTTGRVGRWSPVSEVYVGGQPHVLSPVATDNSGSPTFTWTPVDDAASYEVYFYNANTRQIVHRATGLTVTQWTSFAVPDDDYRFWVRAYDADNNPAIWSRAQNVSVQAATIAVTTTPLGPLGPTFNLTPTFSWEADGPATSYDVQLWHAGETIVQEQLTSASWTPAANLTAGPWQWAVRARTNDGVGPWAFASVDTSARPQVFAPMGSVSVQPLFEWTPVAGATGYILHIDNLTSGQSGVISEQLTDTSWSPAVPFDSADYRVWVRALRDDGPPSPWSIPQDFTVACHPAGEADDWLALADWWQERFADLRQMPVATTPARAESTRAASRPSYGTEPADTMANTSEAASTTMQRERHRKPVANETRLLDQLMSQAGSWQLLDHVDARPELRSAGGS